MPILIAGHSAGAARIQTYCNDTGNAVTGQILYAATLLSAFNNLSYPTATLMVGGEKDGMMRITRFAEATFVYRSQAEKFPVVVIAGANHMSFASGEPPLAVSTRDLRAEVNESVAHEAIALATADFIRLHVAVEEGKGGGHLAALRSTTADLVGALVDALLMEGSHHLQRPCNSDHPSPHCPWWVSE